MKEDILKSIVRSKVKHMVSEYKGEDPSKLLGIIKEQVESLIKEENGK